MVYKCVVESVKIFLSFFERLENVENLYGIEIRVWG